jgi:hypothetical protein
LKKRWLAGNPCFGANSAYIPLSDDVEPRGSVIERPRICNGRRRMYARLGIFVVVSIFDPPQARVFSRSLS